MPSYPIYTFPQVKVVQIATRQISTPYRPTKQFNWIGVEAMTGFPFDCFRHFLISRAESLLGVSVK